MSYFWIFVYILFVIFVLTLFFWSTFILLQQKKVWEKFAKKHDLVFRKAGFFESGAVEGNYKKHRIGLFSEGRRDEATRGMIKYRTVIEVVFDFGMPAFGALGNENSLHIIDALNFGTPHHPDYKGWNKRHLITCSNRKFIVDYLTPKRMDKLNGFFNMKNVIAMMIFDKEDAFLRVEMGDPMTDPKKIEQLLDKLIVLGQDLKLTKEEEKKWVQASDQAPLEEEEASST